MSTDTQNLHEHPFIKTADREFDAWWSFNYAHLRGAIRELADSQREWHRQTWMQSRAVIVERHGKLIKPTQETP